MDEPTEKEVEWIAKLVGVFYAHLRTNGIPDELAALLTRDYFNSLLSWGDDNGGDGEVPDPLQSPLPPFADSRFIRG